MKILVIGGPKFFGRDIVEQALDAGHTVTIFSRGNLQPGFWDRIEHIEGDRTDQPALQQALSGREFDVVVDNIALTAEHVDDVLGAIKGNAGRYILTSSVAVYLGADRFSSRYVKRKPISTRPAVSSPISRRRRRIGLSATLGGKWRQNGRYWNRMRCPTPSSVPQTSRDLRIRPAAASSIFSVYSMAVLSL